MSYITNSQLFCSNLDMVNLVPPGMGLFPGEYVRGRGKGKVAGEIWEGIITTVDLGI